MDSTVIFINGGTGFIGRAFCAACLKMCCRNKRGIEDPITIDGKEREYKLFVQTRVPSHHRHNAITFVSSYDELPDNVVPDVIVNLAGAPIAEKRWSRARKKVLLDSRIKLTEDLYATIKAKGHSPRVVINASAIGYYGIQPDKDCVEDSPPGDGFAASLCQRWEAVAHKFEVLGARVCCMRIGIVLGPGGGALGKLLPLFKFCLGGPIASGNQWFSWVHICDLVRLMITAIHNDKYSGAINATGPIPVNQKEFAKALGRVLRRPSFIYTPGFVLRMIFGQMATELLIGGQKVIPAKAEALGFTFEYLDVDSALADVTQI